MTGKLIVPVSAGFRMRVDISDGFGRAVATSGAWEPQVTAIFRELLSSGDVCVDVGANLGYYALLAAKLVGPDGRVYAVEPAPDVHAALLANVELNGFANVTALCVAAGAGAAEAILDEGLPGQSIRAAIRPRAVAGETVVSVRSIASLLDSADLARVRLVKIDVEGYEIEVLRGLEPVLAAGVRPNVLVEVHSEVLEAAVGLLAEFAANYDFGVYVLSDSGVPPARCATGDQLLRSLELAYERHVLLRP